MRVVLEFFGQHFDFRWNRWARRQRGERRSVQTRHFGYVIEIHELWQVAVFDAVFGADVLVLVVVIFTEFRKSHGGKALLIERIVVASAQKPVDTKDGHRLNA